ncbi:MAG: hypothetical protein HC803_08720 [Saprospiraceae bacterium]|nr:hypothetical protein [Saprospiraceae bacterium]
MHSLTRVTGFDNAGLYQMIVPLQGEIKFYTTDGYFFFTKNATDNFNLSTEDTTDKEAYVEVNDFIKYVEQVEEVFKNIDIGVWEGDIICSLENQVMSTATRIRVHSYGYATSLGNNVIEIAKEELKEFALENAIPNAQYNIVPNIPKYGRRKLEFKNNQDYQNGAFKYLRLHADENGFRSNPSPYIIVKRPNNTIIEDQVDMGQIFYGFESLVFPNIGKGYSKYFNINIPYDLAAVIANIATPIPEVLFHQERGGSVYNNSPLIAPATPDLLEYYEISAPDADLFGNADAMGLFVAYKKLRNNQNLKLSDVLRLYYKDENPKGLTVDSTITKYTVNYRWFLVAEYFELLEYQLFRDLQLRR